MKLYTVRVPRCKGAGFNLDRVGIGNQIICAPKPFSVALNNGLGALAGICDRDLGVWNDCSGVVENGTK